jgi:hypothetical protein
MPFYYNWNAGNTVNYTGAASGTAIGAGGTVNVTVTAVALHL